MKDSITGCFFVDISPENKTFPTRSTIPNFVEVPPISIQIASGSIDVVVEVVAITSI